MQDFSSEFRNLGYVIRNAERILLFAHTRPDPDTVGANIALREYLRSVGKTVDIACFDRLPIFAAGLFPGIVFRSPDDIDFSIYDAVIASDSVDRGFHLIRDKIPEKTVVALIDHHPNIQVEGDIRIIDTGFSSSAEIVFSFFRSQEIEMTPKTATPLLMGILGDTGNLQHSCTSLETFAAASTLIQKGAQLQKITSDVFANNEISTLKLWGKALSRARINQANGMIYSAITETDIADLGNPSTEDLYIASTMLNTVPDAKFSLLFYQIDPETVRGSLRSEPHKGVDVSAIAKTLGGGGHTLSSGFEIKGRIVEMADDWEIR
ncbi:MAG: DHH family phosphoesterase [Candidatus Moranbacteria bacterium]|nr:DHH family phosphoesterase [Candidatus Moranbacteria bacterium]